MIVNNLNDQDKVEATEQPSTEPTESELIRAKNELEGWGKKHQGTEVQP